MQDNKQETARAFNLQSAIFDDLYQGNTIIQYKRERVRSHVLGHLPANSSILELNSGTGEDAVFFGKKGFRVHATDLSEGMLKVLLRKTTDNQLEDRVSQERCSFTELSELGQKGPYDMIFSNFAGLNCTADLKQVLRQFAPLLKPGGLVTLVILPRFCLWETLLLLKGQFKTAFRRFFGKRGRKAHIEGTYFLCWYYSPAYVRNCLKKSFVCLGTEGLCTLVPPSYIEHFAESYPRLYSTLKRLESRWKNKWPWKNIGDYYIISFRKKGEGS
jgi:ubiquinone/menaquinone biosynthesis C-methylase UbiE